LAIAEAIALAVRFWWARVGFAVFRGVFFADFAIAGLIGCGVGSRSE
jgi:hypothetical protein